jgi:hypothetical protein
MFVIFLISTTEYSSKLLHQDLLLDFASIKHEEVKIYYENRNFSNSGYFFQ